METSIEALIPIAGCVMIAAVVIGPIWIISKFRNAERQRLHDTLRLMVERGQPVSNELLETLKTGVKPRGPKNDMRTGVIMLAVALGMAGWGLVLGLTGSGDAVGMLCGLAAFPGFIGLGFIALAMFNRDKPQA